MNYLDKIKQRYQKLISVTNVLGHVMAIDRQLTAICKRLGSIEIYQADEGKYYVY